MKPNDQYLNSDISFWAYVKLISESLGYSIKDSIKSHSKIEISHACKKLGIVITEEELRKVHSYLCYRAEILNDEVQHNLMKAEEAKIIFNDLYRYHVDNNFSSSLPYNKQKGEMRQYAFFTCIINILTEQVLRSIAAEKELLYGKDICFDDNPRKLAYFKNENHSLDGIFSRRFDGVIPSVVNPRIVWEIKEYYYATTFGSRVADGVYETQLDGYEINQISAEKHIDIFHTYFIDAYGTWWNQGKSYLCRIIDILNMGLVDEVIVGREAISRWPELLGSLLKQSIF